jgi:hypothetical protein
VVQLVSDKRQKNQLVLAFPEESRSEAPIASEEGTESLAAKRRSESPAIGERLMEDVCDWHESRLTKGVPGWTV